MRCEEYDINTEEKIHLYSIQSFCVITSFLTADLISRLKHSVYENLKPQSLFCNSVLMMLIRAITDNIFKDYSTMKKLLKIKLLKNEMYYLQQNESVLSKFFFYIVFTDEMKKADIFSRHLRKLKVYAEYLQLLTIYDFRMKNLYLINRVSLSSLLT